MTDQLDSTLHQGLADRRVAQGAQLGLALDAVVRSELRIDVARVTAQLGAALPDLGLQHPHQAIHRNLLQVRLPVPLPVEIREVAGPRVFSQGQPVLQSQLEEERE